MSRVPVTPENPLGLVRDIQEGRFLYDRDIRSKHETCPVCSRGNLFSAAVSSSQRTLEWHEVRDGYDGWLIEEGEFKGWCPGSRMILEEYQPVTLEDCNRKLDEILEELES